MFTKFFYQSLAYVLGCANSYEFQAKAHNGEIRTVSSNLHKVMEDFDTAINNPTNASKTSSFNSGVVFGSNDTPASKDDYQLIGDHFTTFVSTVAKRFDPDLCTTTITYTLTNTGDTAFTIKEVGVFVAPYYLYLVYRQVLDSPVTIQPNGIGQVTLTFKVNVPE